MNKKETPRRLGEQATGQNGNDFSNNQSTTNGNPVQDIFPILPFGEENAISSKVLAQMVGASSVRELQHRVATEREHGALILSSCRNGGGYYRPSDGPEGKREIAAFIQTLQARALNTLVAIRAARKALEAVEGQLNLDDTVAIEIAEKEA